MRTNHQIMAFQKPIFLHESSVAVAPSPLSGAHNTAYTAHFVRPNSAFGTLCKHAEYQARLLLIQGGGKYGFKTSGNQVFRSCH